VVVCARWDGWEGDLGILKEGPTDFPRRASRRRGTPARAGRFEAAGPEGGVPVTDDFAKAVAASDVAIDFTAADSSARTLGGRRRGSRSSSEHRARSGHMERIRSAAAKVRSSNPQHERRVTSCSRSGRRGAGAGESTTWRSSRRTTVSRRTPLGDGGSSRRPVAAALGGRWRTRACTGAVHGRERPARRSASSPSAPATWWGAHADLRRIGERFEITHRATAATRSPRRRAAAAWVSASRRAYDMADVLGVGNEDRAVRIRGRARYGLADPEADRPGDRGIRSTASRRPARRAAREVRSRPVVPEDRRGGSQLQGPRARDGKTIPRSRSCFSRRPPRSTTRGEIVYPSQSQRVDYEAELAVVIGGSRRT